MPRAEHTTPLIPEIHPKIHPESSPRTKILKIYGIWGVFVHFSYFFRILVSGEDSGCILGCILGIRGVLYSVRGAGDRRNIAITAFVSWLLSHTWIMENRGPETAWKCLICFTVRVKIITGSLVILESSFPQNYRYRYRLEVRMNSFNYHYRYRLRLLASAVTPSFPLIPNYRLESHLN